MLLNIWNGTKLSPPAVYTYLRTEDIWGIWSPPQHKILTDQEKKCSSCDIVVHMQTNNRFLNYLICKQLTVLEQAAEDTCRNITSESIPLSGSFSQMGEWRSDTKHLWSSILFLCNCLGCGHTDVTVAQDWSQ